MMSQFSCVISTYRETLIFFFTLWKAGTIDLFQGNYRQEPCHLRKPTSESISKRLIAPMVITKHKREKMRSRRHTGGGGSGETHHWKTNAHWKMNIDTRNSSMKNEIAKWLEGGWIVNSTRLRTAMRAIQVRNITPIRALLLNLCVVMPCNLWYRWYATRGEPTQKKDMRRPTSKVSMKVVINLSFSLHSSRDALALVGNAI